VRAGWRLFFFFFSPRDEGGEQRSGDTAAAGQGAERGKGTEQSTRWAFRSRGFFTDRPGDLGPRIEWPVALLAVHVHERSFVSRPL